MKRFQGILNSTPEKRYKHFLWFTADHESVWLLSNEDGYHTIDLDGVIYLLVWPEKTFAEAYNKEDIPIELDIYDFCDRCREINKDDNIKFMIFPTSKDTYIINPEDLLNDLLEELSLIE